MNEDTLFRGVGVEVRLPDPEAFLKIKETLSRIGVASRKDNTLFQSTHILHKQGRYALVHFKEMFVLDGKPTNISEEDLGRRNTIVKLLEEWGLVEIVEKEKSETPITPLSKIKILPFSEKSKWNLVPKYTIGSDKRRTED